MKMPGQTKTAEYYSQRAEECFERTNGLDLSSAYEPFERQLRPGSRILDLGSGSGRDARHGAARGHWVIAADPCRELLSLAFGKTFGELRFRIQFVMGAAPQLCFGAALFDILGMRKPLALTPRQNASCAHGVQENTAAWGADVHRREEA